MLEFLNTTWSWIVRIVKWVALKFLAPWFALVIVIGAVVLVAIGFKDVRIGGLLGKLLGRDLKKAVAATTPPNRVDQNGKPIPLGVPDSKGIVQVPVIPVEIGLFSDPNIVTFVPPGEDKPVKVVLPDGVEIKDVDSVLVIKPDVTVVAVKEGSSIPVERIDDLLAKYSNI